MTRRTRKIKSELGKHTKHNKQNRAQEVESLELVLGKWPWKRGGYVYQLVTKLWSIIWENTLTEWVI